VARRVAWTETAWRDLERIADYIAEDSPGYAASFVRHIRVRARSLGEMIERIVEEDVFVLALIHGARDIPAVWDDEARDAPRDG
jgi:plasmid stabilization system protein ParE